ncbi:hypothetical protein [Polaribacter sp. MED152]|uniref:hypothetical protein n=1 Tax=Polaribacter sp. MED152 TaxID=313598 RepID=UPI000068C92E|nr:hypothetical protein [Polaribacter sp. MED152]EAQ41296.1 hypothetical protein MED152_01240 [Polaribacter sp. MED152]
MKYFLTLVLTILLFSCNEKNTHQNDNIEGLWLVKKVNMNNQDLTPIAKWMRFNADSTQSSGNGWLQHTVGSWSVSASNELSLTNTYGIKDNAEPFKVKFLNGKMIWNRVEEGNPIEVVLERTDKLPTSEANKLYGLWKFNSIIEDDKDVSKTLNPSKNAMLFLRWDNTYELRNYPKGTKYGIFKTHGHRLQLDMVSYSKKPEFQFYNYNLKDTTLVLKSTNSKKEVKLTRIHQFLQ